MNACKGGREISAGAEAGARLSCHLLFRLFKAIEFGNCDVNRDAQQTPGPNPTPVDPSATPRTYGKMVDGIGSIKLSCDRHLLAATHKNLAVGPVLAVLKGILVVGDAMNPENHKQPTSNKRGNRNTAPPQPAPQPAAQSGKIEGVIIAL